MSWKHIKTVLIFLFLTINIYLIYSSVGNFTNSSNTLFDNDSISKTVGLIKNNFAISIDEKIIPRKLVNLKNINATNIIYTEEFERSEYEFAIENGAFSVEIKTSEYSYNQSNATTEIKRFLKNIGIYEDTFNLDFSISDEGLMCVVSEKLSEYDVFNGKIVATFKASTMHVKGKWHIAEDKPDESESAALKMIPISGVIVDVAERMKNEMTGTKITDIRYGYYVSYYDENTVSKSASAIPSYMMETETGYKYYYDAINGKSLKQEE